MCVAASAGVRSSIARLNRAQSSYVATTGVYRRGAPALKRWPCGAEPYRLPASDPLSVLLCNRSAYAAVPAGSANTPAVRARRATSRYMRGCREGHRVHLGDEPVAASVAS